MGLLIIAALILVLISIIGGNDDSSSSNHNGVSVNREILAKNCFADYIKGNMKDPKSFKEVSYTSDYNSSKGCYEVTLNYRGKNSFGALVLEQASGDVYITDDSYSIRNVRTE